MDPYKNCNSVTVYRQNQMGPNASKETHCAWLENAFCLFEYTRGFKLIMNQGPPPRLRMNLGGPPSCLERGYGCIVVQTTYFISRSIIYLYISLYIYLGGRGQCVCLATQLMLSIQLTVSALKELLSELKGLKGTFENHYQISISLPKVGDFHLG